MRLRGKIVAVTGASRGLGLALSKAFAAEGAKVAMLARTPPEVAAQEVDGSLPIICDVSKPEDVRMGFAQIATHFGGLDILVNNAAQGYPQPIEEAADDLLKLQVEVNLLGPLYCMREAIPRMRVRGAGDIVNISSESVHNPYPFLGLYAATKSALETLSAAIRAEVIDTDIRITVYRSGRLTGTFSSDWDPLMKERARSAAKEAGFYERSDEVVPVHIAANEILELVLLDRSERPDLLKPGDLK